MPSRRCIARAPPTRCNLMIDVVPSGIEDFVEHVVPILQKRGLLRREPTGRTLRESMGLGSQ